ncbi:hypothetical protein AKJ16_DCAP01362 [Drosera capensis]
MYGDDDHELRRYLVGVAVRVPVLCSWFSSWVQGEIASSNPNHPSFTLSHSTPTLNFTLSQFLSLHNPNRIFPFSHYDSTLLLFVSGTQLGSLFIRAGNVPAGGTQLIGATFDVKGCEVGVGEGMVMEMEMRVRVNGKVRVLRVFAHRIGKEVTCWISAIFGLRKSYNQDSWIIATAMQ